MADRILQFKRCINSSPPSFSDPSHEPMVEFIYRGYYSSSSRRISLVMISKPPTKKLRYRHTQMMCSTAASWPSTAMMGIRLMMFSDPLWTRLFSHWWSRSCIVRITRFLLSAFVFGEEKRNKETHFGSIWSRLILRRGEGIVDLVF
jgi:hypothetical protein